MKRNLKDLFRRSALSLSIVGSVAAPFGAHAQNFDKDFERQLFIQKYEELADALQSRFDLGMNIVVLDMGDNADLSFISSFAAVKSDYHYFMASAYNERSSMNGKTQPGCVIFINYKNKSSFFVPNYFEAKYGREKALQFLDYMYISHETGHCLAQKTLKTSWATQEKYADSIATFFIKNSSYKPMIGDWIESLKLNKPPHNTYNYVAPFYERTQNINSLPEILNQIK